MTVPSWKITKSFANTDVASCLHILMRFFVLTAEKITSAPINEVINVESSTESYYVKRYTDRGARLNQY